MHAAASAGAVVALLPLFAARTKVEPVVAPRGWPVAADSLPAEAPVGPDGDGGASGGDCGRRQHPVTCGTLVTVVSVVGADAVTTYAVSAVVAVAPVVPVVCASPADAGVGFEA